MRLCDCGGEMYLDWFDPITRPIEWFMRCATCGATTASCPTKEEAEAQAGGTASV